MTAFPVPPVTHSVILVICGCLKSWGQGSLQNLTGQIPWDDNSNQLFVSLCYFWNSHSCGTVISVKIECTVDLISTLRTHVHISYTYIIYTNQLKPVWWWWNESLAGRATRDLIKTIFLLSTTSFQKSLLTGSLNCLITEISVGIDSTASCGCQLAFALCVKCWHAENQFSGAVGKLCASNSWIDQPVERTWCTKSTSNKFVVRQPHGALLARVQPYLIKALPTESDAPSSPHTLAELTLLCDYASLECDRGLHRRLAYYAYNALPCAQHMTVRWDAVHISNNIKTKRELGAVGCLPSNVLCVFPKRCSLLIAGLPMD